MMAAFKCFVKWMCIALMIVSMVYLLSYLLLYENADIFHEIAFPDVAIPLINDSKASLSFVPPPLTIQTNYGRLGNQMFTFATLLGLGILNGRHIALMPELHYELSKFFDMDYPVVNLDTFEETDPWPIGNWLFDEDSDIPLTSNILMGNMYPTSFTFFHHCRPQIIDAFRFHPTVRRHAQGRLRKLKELRPSTQVYVGVHVRRDDYIKKGKGGWLGGFNGREVDGEFFRKAVDYFTNKYDNVTFLAVSDDKKWCEKHLTEYDIFIAPWSPSAEYDMALLVECNHTIMTYGTYGFWGGYLSGGEVVYFEDFLQPNTTLTQDYFVMEKMYPPDWIGISTAKPGYWETYINPFKTSDESDE